MKRTIVNGGHDLRTPAGTEDIDVKALERDLQRAVRGEVRFDAAYRAIYSHDSSNYRQQPIGVVVPADQDDVVAAIAACRAHDAPVLPRGCGTSLSGETAHHAVVIDTSRNRHGQRWHLQWCGAGERGLRACETGRDTVPRHREQPDRHPFLESRGKRGRDDAIGHFECARPGVDDGRRLEQRPVG